MPDARNFRHHAGFNFMKVMNEIGERIFRLRGEAGTVRLANESGISSAVC